MRRTVLLLLLLIVAVVAIGRPAAADATGPPFQRSFGTGGSGPGQFSQAEGMALDAEGRVYVADLGNDRVSVFDAGGQFVRSIGTGTLDGPMDVLIGADGGVYVTDNHHHRIAHFSSTGTFLGGWNATDDLEDPLFSPKGLAQGPNGHLYVTDSNRVVEYTTAGEFVRQWGSYGTGDTQFMAPWHLLVDDTGDVLVIDSSSTPRHLKRFSSTGVFEASYDIFDDEEITSPREMAFDLEGNIVVTDAWNSRIGVYTPGGGLLGTWGTAGLGTGQLSDPWGLAIDRAGTVYVSDATARRVQVFGEGAGRPDGRIRSGAGALVGDDVYNTTAQGQGRSGLPRPGATVTFTISVQNDGPEPDRLVVRGGAGQGRYTVRYLVGSTNVTSRVAAGTWRTPVLAPGAAKALTVQVTAAANAARNSSITRLVTAASQNDPSASDAVRFTVYVNRAGGG